MQIIHEGEYESTQQLWPHLFDICQPKLEMIEKNKDWMVRDGFDRFGTLLVGDLRVIKHATKVLEIHPFPEWVVQMKLNQKSSGKVYAIIPKIPEKVFSKFENKEWNKRGQKIQEFIDTLTLNDFLAIEYSIGICIKIPSNVPHEFLSVVSASENIPYCQVFEPNMEKIAEVLKQDPTSFLNLKEEIKLSN